MSDSITASILSQKIYENLEEFDVFGQNGRYEVKATTGINLPSGYYGTIILDTQTNTNYLVSRGTEPTSLADLSADGNLTFGGVTSQYSDVKSFYNSYVEQHQNDADYVPITVAVGHSLGGYISQAVGIIADLEVVTFGSPGAQAILDNLELDGYANQVAGYDYSRITNIIAEHDPIGNSFQHLVGSNVEIIDTESVVDKTVAGRLVSAVIESSNALGLADETVITISNPAAGILYTTSKEGAAIHYYHSMKNYAMALKNASDIETGSLYIEIVKNETYTMSFIDADGVPQEVYISPAQQGILTYNMRIADFEVNGTVISQNIGTVSLYNASFDFIETITENNGDQQKTTRFFLSSGATSPSNGVREQVFVAEKNASGNFYVTKETTVFVDRAGREHTTLEFREAEDANWKVQESIYDPATQTSKTGDLYIVPSDILLQALQTAGDTAGSLLGDRLADGDVYKGIVYSAFFKTVGEHFGTFASFLAVDNSFDQSVDVAVNGGNIQGTVFENQDFYESFLNNLQVATSGSLSNLILQEVGDVLGIEGTIGDEVFEVVGGSITTGFISGGIDVLFNNLEGSAYGQILNNGFDFDKVIKIGGVETTVADYIELNVYSALASYAGSRLAGEIISPESMQAAIFGSFGSAVGIAITTGAGFLGPTAISAALSTAFASAGSFVPVIGTAIGAFIGQIAGTVLGNLFGSQDEPFASAHIGFDRDAAQYSILSTSAEDGGNATVAHSMAAAAMNGVNAIIEMTHGTMRRGSASNVEIGYDGDKMFVNANGNYVEFERSGDAIKFAALQLLESADIVGGHAILMRAWHNSEATTLEQFQQDLFVAEVFQTYLINPTGVLALMMNEPDSEAAQQWAAILQRAAELELHLPHERDIDGGWGEVLAARGDINPESIPDIQGDSLILHDSITGEEIVLEHVIGPGYEIVRIPGTDGDDIIQINVDGPSIAYVTTGPGNDHFIGHDGADIFIGGSGDDTAQGGDGNDWLIGNEGDDALYGEGGDDLLIGGDGNDLLVGAQGVDTIYGGSGDDIIDGGEEANYLYGGAGNDTIMANNGLLDEVYGGEGDDIIHGTLYDHIYGEAGNDTFYVNGAAAYIRRGDGHDTVYLSHDYSGQIVIDKSIGANEIILSKQGADLILSIAGEDQSITIKDIYNHYNTGSAQAAVLTVLGVIGNHQGYVHYSLTSSVNNYAPYPTYAIGYLSNPDGVLGTFIGGVQETNVALTDYLSATSNVPDIVMGSDAPSSIYDLSQPGPLSHSYFYGAGGNDYLWLGGSGFGLGSGGMGDDTIIAGMDDDELYGGSGNDTIWGVSGDDYIDGGSGNDELYGDYPDNYDYIGNDTIYGREGDDTIHGNLGDDFIHGNEGADKLFGDDGKDVLIGDDGDDQIKGGSGTDKLYGGIGNDFLFGNSDDDYLKGGDRNDVLYGGSGADNLWGDGGSDQFVFTPEDGNYTDTILDFETGIDKVVYRDTEVTQIEEVEAGVLITFLSGGKALLDGVSLNNFDENNDIVEGPPVLNEVHGTAGNDYVYGTSGRDVLYAYAGIDNVLGGEGDDILYGQEGDDGLYGEGGADILHGGTGNDAYVYQSPDSVEGDIIEDDGASSADMFVFQNIDTSFTFPVLRLESGNSTDLLIETIWGTLTVKNQFAQDGEDRIEIIQTYRSGISNYLYLTSGALTFMGNDSDEILTMPSYGIGAAGNQIYGEGGNDIITGSSYAETLYGGSENDTLNGAAGNDGINGGDGTDTAVYSGVYANYTISGATTLTVTDTTGADGTDTLNGIERIQFADGLWQDGVFTLGSVPGTTGNDTINGTTANDTILGLSENDLIYGSAGADAIDGGSGIDTVDYRTSTSAITIDLQNNSFSGGDAQGDVLISIENITGSDNSSLRDTIYGDANANIILGLAGNDILEGGAGADTVDGGAGWDYASYMRSTAAVNLNMVTGVYSSGDAQGDTILNTEGYRLSAYNDVFVGNSTDEFVVGGYGNDILDGGAGSDTVSYDSATSGVLVNLAMTGIQNTGGAGYDTISNFENLIGSSRSDSLKGTSGNNSIQGDAGNDTIEGKEGDDILDGGSGTDYVSYRSATFGITFDISITTAQNTVGAGIDTAINFENLWGSDYNDILLGSSSNNNIKSEYGNDTLCGRAGNDYLDGGDGTDTAVYSGVYANFTITGTTTLTVTDATGVDGTDTVISVEKLQFADGYWENGTFVPNASAGSINGTSGDDTLNSASGGDIINGLAGNDTINAGSGNDIVDGGAGNDIMDGGDGIDTLSYESATGAVLVSLYATSVQSTYGGGYDTISNFENLIGSSSTDTLRGNSGDNDIQGGAGNDTIEGMDGNDTLNGGTGTDYISYRLSSSGIIFDLSITTAQDTQGSGIDTAINFENLWGSEYNDTLSGASGNNVLKGETGDDTLNGKAGNDILIGGLGSDIFVFDAQSVGGGDSIKDFSVSDGDKIDIKDLLVGYDDLTCAITDFVEFTTSGANTIAKVDRDGAGTTYGWQQIATIENVTGLTDEAALKTNGNLIVA